MVKRGRLVVPSVLLSHLSSTQTAGPRMISSSGTSSSGFHRNNNNSRQNPRFAGFQPNRTSSFPTTATAAAGPQLIFTAPAPPPVASHYLLATPAGPTTSTSAASATLSQSHSVAINRQRLNVLLSDVENLLAVHREKGVTAKRAALHLARADRYLEQLEELSYTQLLAKVSLEAVQRMKLALEVLACDLQQQQQPQQQQELLMRVKQEEAQEEEINNNSSSKRKDHHLLVAYPANDDDELDFEEDLEDDELELELRI
ncbi:hypothetical protein TYRP_021745 [Tyrophagus putrescentiae]|nr:hypothetical protein TYRP_021745 [Tyrophagus putrescentiae]